MTFSSRRAALAGALVLAATALAGTASAHNGGPDHTIKLVEASANAQPIFVDTGKPGPSIGDQVIVKDGLNRLDGARAGDFTQVCTLMTLGTSPLDSGYECTGSIALANGTITLQGPFNPSLAEQSAAVTGGTGEFRAARGELSIRAEDDRITVHLARY
jgi:hypothetical protein